LKVESKELRKRSSTEIGRGRGTEGAEKRRKNRILKAKGAAPGEKKIPRKNFSD
jgi:hypothetical protein